MLISIDHGNKQVKPSHRTFTTMLIKSAARPPFGEKILEYGGKYYAIFDSLVSLITITYAHFLVFL